MLRSLLVGGALALLAGAAAAAQPETAERTMVCVDVNGMLRPADCRAQASRVKAEQDICLCSGGGRQVEASVCPPGVTPPGESLAAAKARNAALREGKSLVGLTLDGRPLCVTPRQH